MSNVLCHFFVNYPVTTAWINITVPHKGPSGRWMKKTWGSWKWNFFLFYFVTLKCLYLTPAAAFFSSNISWYFSSFGKSSKIDLIVPGSSFKSDTSVPNTSWTYANNNIDSILTFIWYDTSDRHHSLVH